MSGPNTSATGGIMIPSPLVPVLESTPPGLTLVEFIQSILVGLSNIPGSLVRPDWQQQPPKNPDINVNWVAFGIGSIEPDANAFQGINASNVVTLQRQETLEIQVSCYGPASADNITLIRDGFQIPQNTAALLLADMAFVKDERAVHLPELVNERWFDRWTTNFYLHRYVVRTYPVLNFLSATGIVYAQTANNPNYQLNWKAGG